MTARKDASPRRLALPLEQEARARAVELSIAIGTAGLRPEDHVARAMVFATYIETGTLPSKSETTA